MQEDTLQQAPRAHKRSSLAVLQQAIVLSTWALAIAAVLLWWGESPVFAVWLGMAILMGYSGLLWLEFLLAAQQHGEDPAPRSGWTNTVKAWWEETWAAAAVFGWRQPFAWQRLADTLAVSTSAAETSRVAGQGPVVFIHGFVCNRGFWHPWMRALRTRGVPYASVNLEPILGRIDGFVGQVEAAIRAVEAAEGHGSALKPVLICHSMGGLVARAWLAAATQNSRRVQRVITIGTPHHGTWLARWGHSASGRQMRIGSEWLASLKAKETSSIAPPVPFTCWYSNTDNIVFPPSTATLPGADNRLIPHTGHVALAFHPTVMRESLAMLASGASSPMLRTDA